MAVDAACAVYLTGSLPGVLATPGAFKTTGTGSVAIRVNAQGSALIYATYLPPASPAAIAIDAQGNAYITGSAGAREFPVTSKLPAEDPASPSITSDVFALKLSAARIPSSEAWPESFPAPYAE